MQLFMLKLGAVQSRPLTTHGVVIQQQVKPEQFHHIAEKQA